MSSVFICTPMVYMWNLLGVMACWWCEQSYRHMFTLFSSALAPCVRLTLAAGAFVKCPHAISILLPHPHTKHVLSLIPLSTPTTVLQILSLCFSSVCTFQPPWRIFWHQKRHAFSPSFDIFFLCLVLPYPSVFSPSHHCYYFLFQLPAGFHQTQSVLSKAALQISGATIAEHISSELCLLNGAHTVCI